MELDIALKIARLVAFFFGPTGADLIVAHSLKGNCRRYLFRRTGSYFCEYSSFSVLLLCPYQS